MGTAIAYTDDKFVGSTDAGHWFYIFHVLLLMLSIPVFWEPQLSFWLSIYRGSWKQEEADDHASNKGCVNRNAVFISKVVPLFGSIAFLVARVGYLLAANQVRASERSHYVDPNVIVTAVSCGIVIAISLYRLVWHACRCLKGSAPEGPMYTLLLGNDDLRGEILGISQIVLWVARLLLLATLCLDVNDRSGPVATTLGVLGVFLCAVSVVDGLWFTFAQSSCRGVAPKPLPSATDPSRGDVVDPFVRARLLQRALTWITGCFLLSPVQFLRPGNSF